MARGNSNNTASLTQKVFVCPGDADPHGVTIPNCANNPATPWPGVTSYMVNAYFFFGLSEAAVTVPANTIYIAERNPAFCDVHIHPWLGKSTTRRAKRGRWTPGRSEDRGLTSRVGLFGIASARHSHRREPARFADGHVKVGTVWRATIQPTADQP